MDNKDNLTARDLEVLEAKKALSSKEIAQMEDFSIRLTNGEVLDIGKFVERYPDPDLPLSMQIPKDDE